MNSIHDHIEDLMATALTGGLSTEEQQSFDRHLAECPDCRKLYQEEKMTASMLEDALSPDRPPMDFEERMVRRFRRDLVKQNVNGFERIYAAFARFCRMPGISAVATAAVLAVLVVLGNMLSPATSQVRESARTDGGNIFYVSGHAQFKKTFDAGADGTNGFMTKVEPTVTATAQNGRTFALPGGTVTVPVIVSEGKATRAIGTADSGRRSGTITSSAVVHMTGNQKPPDQNVGVGGKAINDKVPFIGDIPAVGELFRSKPGEPVPNFTFNEQTASFVINGFDYKEEAPDASKGKRGSPGSATTEPTASQKLIRNASLEFEIQNFESAQERIRVIADEESGYIATSNSARLSNGKVRGQIIVKVLPGNLDRLLLKLRALGDLKNQSIATQDVTKAYYDTEARMRNSKRMEDRLLKMLDEAKGKVTDLLVVEKELARVRQEIEEMQGQIKVYDALVAYATVTLTLYEKDMNQPAAFLLKEHANLGLFSSDVEKTFREARLEAEAAKGQIIQSNMTRDNEGNASATLRLVVAPENSDSLLAALKKMGRVQSLTWQHERVAQEGSGVSETARVEKDKVQISLAIVHDDESRKQVSLSVVTKSVEEALDKAKAEAAARNAEVLASSLERGSDGHAAAQFTARVPAKSYSAFLNAIKAFGRVSQFTIQRNDQSSSAKESEDAPVLLSLTLTDQEPAVQQTGMNLLTDAVEAKSADIKSSATAKGAEIQTSTFEHTPDGREVAVFSIRVPMNKYPAFVEYLRGLGEVKDFAVHRQDLPGATGGTDAPAEITVQIYSRGNIVADNTGFFATIRKTLGEGTGALMWSVRMIGVALAFLFPWLITIGIGGSTIWLIGRRRH